MTLNPRLPNNENPLQKHEAASGTADGGAVMYLTESGTVAKVTTSGQAPFGILFHNVKSSLAGLPAGYEFPGEIGSADMRLGDPVLVHFEGGIFETDHYRYLGSSGIPAGTLMYAHINNSDHDGKLVNDDGSTVDVADDGDGSTAKAVALVLEGLSDDEADAGKALTIKLLI